MALLAAFAATRSEDESLENFLDAKVFVSAHTFTLSPDVRDENGFAAYIKQYKQLLKVEEAAVEFI